MATPTASPAAHSERCEPAWTARVALFSGRPDPSWTLSPSTAARVLELWSALPAASERGLDPPPLGYRGCVVDDHRGRRWEAYGGTVRCGQERRSDPPRVFERLVLASAPPGAVPAGVIRP